ncbi:MAG: hypothetical protein ACOCXA_02155, partial [Planctomycetota bacterium]
MRKPRLPLVCCLLGACASPVLMAAEATGTDTAAERQGIIAQLDAEQAALYMEAEGFYQQALVQYRAARLLEARKLVDKALSIFPGHPEAQELRARLGAMLSERSESLEATANWMMEQKQVAAQEQAVRVANLIAEGDKALAAGDFRAAHRAYDRADIAMRTFSQEYDWGDRPQQVAAKLAEAVALARQADLEEQAEAREQARQRETELAQLQEQVLSGKVDEIMRRAKDAYRRRDFRAAAALAWNAYELDRRREDARKLYLDARRA